MRGAASEINFFVKIRNFDENFESFGGDGPRSRDAQTLPAQHQGITGVAPCSGLRGSFDGACEVRRVKTFARKSENFDENSESFAKDGPRSRRAQTLTAQNQRITGVSPFF